MKYFKFAGCMFFVFLAGSVVSNNLVILIGFDKNYPASWGQLSIALLIGVGFSFLAWNQKVSE